MNPEKSWKPLTLVGMVLMLNGLIFSIVIIAMQSNVFWGPIIGSLGAGISLLIIGLLQKKKLKQKAG